MVWMLTALSAKAESNYPSKQIIGIDTVICSTVDQQKKYLGWKLSLDECIELSKIKDNTIFLMDSVMKEQKKLITFQDIQQQNYKGLVKKLDDFSQVQDMRYKSLESAYKIQGKRERKRAFAIGLSGWTILLGVTGLLIYKLIK